jgi:rifampicin phosphotransferase
MVTSTGEGDDRRMDHPLTVPLADALNELEVGAKARNLARLVHLGISVPPAVVLTNAALERFLDAGDLRAPIATACEKLAERSLLATRCAAETISALMHAHPLPDALLAALGTDVVAPHADALIVRSSAIGEDSASASFAGQLDSIPDVRPGPDLHRAIVDVWASRWSARALAYERARGATLRGMGVIVQQQISPVLSGVIFTVAPDSRQDLVVEYCKGMGDALVSGRENPARVKIRRADLQWSRSNDSPVANHAPALSESCIHTLAHTALKIEEAFGQPQDIEWTLDQRGALWFLQARPITTLTATNVHTDTRGGRCRVGDREPDVVHWSNANVNENFPQPISPLLYSVASAGYYHYFRNLGRSFGISRRRLAAMDRPLRQIIGVHGARMYYNLTSIHAVLRSAPFGELLASSFNQFVGSEATHAPAASPFAGRTRGFVPALELCAIAGKTTWQYLSVTRRVERFERTVTTYAERTRPARLEERSLPELLEDFRAFVDIRCHRWNDAALADAGSMVCYGLLQRVLARAFPSDDQQALHNSLLKALPGLVSSIPALELWKLSEAVRQDEPLAELLEITPAAAALDALRRDPRFAEFRHAFDRFVEDWGFRCSGELMLTQPSFQEDPAPLIDLVRAYSRSTADSPGDVLARQEAARVDQTRQVAGRLRGRRIVKFLPAAVQAAAVMFLLRATQRSILLRERARLKQALLYSRFRRVALAIGRRLVDRRTLACADDIFFLTGQEIDDLLAGSAMFPHHVQSLVSMRRQAHADVTASAPPDVLTLGRGEYFGGHVSARGAFLDEGTEAMRGVGVCGGRATARAAVLDDINDAYRLEAGDILVARQTDPGWGPVFPLISGLVMERGGMLSHGAIIAREFGIPSVVGVRDATRRIAHGSRVRVDGDRALVEIVEAARC